MLATLFLLAQDGQQQPDGGNLIAQFAPILAIVVFFLIFVLLPMRKQQRQQQSLLSALKRNDKVVTSGGIVGWVVTVGKDAEAEEVVLKPEENSTARIRVLKTSITRVVPSKEPAAEK